MLKIAASPEERAGAAVMEWWDGDGAARVLAREDDALLLERADGARSLVAMARSGADHEAARIICGTADRLHSPRRQPPPPLVPLPRWFAELRHAAVQHGGVLREAARVADALLDAPEDVVVLHGDLHHGNVLDAGARGWVAIDPKGLIGERAFDFANLFCNPTPDVATAPGRLATLAAAVAQAAHLRQERLRRWVLAYAGLSASWSLADGDDPSLALKVAEVAAAEIARAE